ncbi:MAG: sialidase family protein [Opitutaceae bacterium]|nr:sialidase family protein [Opitutaceae bacterium]
MNSFRFFLAVVLAAFSSPLLAQVPAARTEVPNAAQPQLAVASDGRVWLAYGQAAAGQTAAAPMAHGQSEQHKTPQRKGGKHKGHQPQQRSGDVFVAQSKDGGATFAPAVKIASVPQLMLGNRRGPRIAAHGDRLTVTVVAHELIAFTSTDGGRTWGDPVTVNDVATSAREGLHDLAASPDGQLFVTWLDLRNGKTELWGASSKDGGRMWSKNEQVYRSPDKSICECCHPSALFDDQGNLAVMWRNSIEGTRDMWMATRAKGAKEFSRAKKIGEGTWKLNACPMDGGKIVALGGGKFGAVWQRAGDVFFAPANGSEILLGKGKQPLAFTRGGETIVFWQQGNDLVSVRNPGEGEPMKYAADARFAVVTALPANRGTLLAYEQIPAKDKQPRIVVERL